MADSAPAAATFRANALEGSPAPCVRRMPRRSKRHISSRSIGARQTGAGGFSLLEVLVAFVILSLVTTALFRLFSGALGNASAADDYSRAMLVAESVLAEAASAQPLRETTQTGSADDGKIAWSTSVAAHSPQDVPDDLQRAADTMPVRLFRITSEVTFDAPNGGKRTLTFATMRLGARDQK